MAEFHRRLPASKVIYERCWRSLDYQLLILRWVLTWPGPQTTLMVEVTTMPRWLDTLTKVRLRVSVCHWVSLSVFVMSYDEQSQMWGEGRCEARPNSPLVQTFSGVRKYLQLGVPPTKLILGLPWYGYRYPCLGKTSEPPLPSLTLSSPRVFLWILLHCRGSIPGL